MTTAATDGRVVPTGSGAVAHAPVDPSRERTPLYVWTLLGTLAFSLFSGYSDLLGFPVGPDRVCFAATLALLLISRDRPRLRWRPLYGVMIALVLWTAGSALLADTLVEPLGLFALLDRIVVPFVMFCLGPLVLTTEHRRGLLLRLMTLIGIYLGATAVLEIFGPASLVWPRYIMDESLGIHWGRARGPFLTAEGNGMVMTLALFMSMALWPRVGAAWRVLVVACVGLTTIGIVLCLTRSNWLATVVAGLAAGWLVPRVRRALPILVAALVAALAAVLAAVPALAAVIVERFTMTSSVYDRQNTNAAGLRMVEEHPLFGIGWHRFIDVGAEWVRQHDSYPVTNVVIEIHNVFLSRAAETGIPGAALWALAVVLGPLAALRPMHRSGPERTWQILLLVALVTWAVPSLTSPNPYPLPNNLMWLVGGSAAAGAAARRHPAPGISPPFAGHAAPVSATHPTSTPPRQESP